MSPKQKKPTAAITAPAGPEEMAAPLPRSLESGISNSKSVSVPEEEDSPRATGKAGSATPPDPPFSVFSLFQKRFIVFSVALTTLLPPLTASIFYPVITLLARDLNVTVTDINLTITIYLVRFYVLVHAFDNITDKYKPISDHSRHRTILRGQSL